MPGLYLLAPVRGRAEEVVRRGERGTCRENLTRAPGFHFDQGRKFLITKDAKKGRKGREEKQRVRTTTSAAVESCDTSLFQFWRPRRHFDPWDHDVEEPSHRRTDHRVARAVASRGIGGSHPEFSSGWKDSGRHSA